MQDQRLRNLVVASAVCAVILATSCGYAQNRSQRISDPYKGLTAQGANGDENAHAGLIERVRSFLGTPRLSAPIANIRTVTLDDDRTPFLKDQIRGRPAIHVVLEDVPLPTGGSEGDARANTTLTLDVYVDAETKHLVKIVSRPPPGVAKPPPDYSPEMAEKILAIISEHYTGFPDEPPGIGFLAALEAVCKDGMGDPGSAKQIIGRYVLLTRRVTDVPKPVWIIKLRGIGPIPTPHGRLPASKRDHIRNVVDARTGKWLYATLNP